MYFIERTLEEQLLNLYLNHQRKTFKEEVLIFYRKDSRRKASYPTSKSFTKVFYRRASNILSKGL